MATYTYLNHKTQLLETIDLSTGKILAIGAGADFDYTNKELFDEVVLVDGTIALVAKGVDVNLATMHRSWVYNQSVADLFCQLVAEGKGVTAASREPGMPPYSIVCRWRRERPEFARQLEEARKDRAEGMRDKAMATAEGADEDNIQVDKLKVETYKWAAGVDDQNKYGAKKVQLDENTPLQIIVNTGIVRDVSNQTGVKDVTSTVQTKILESNSGWVGSTSERDEP